MLVLESMHSGTLKPLIEICLLLGCCSITSKAIIVVYTEVESLCCKCQAARWIPSLSTCCRMHAARPSGHSSCGSRLMTTP